MHGSGCGANRRTGATNERPRQKLLCSLTNPSGGRARWPDRTATDIVGQVVAGLPTLCAADSAPVPPVRFLAFSSSSLRPLALRPSGP